MSQHLGKPRCEEAKPCGVGTKHIFLPALETRAILCVDREMLQQAVGLIVRTDRALHPQLPISEGPRLVTDKAIQKFEKLFSSSLGTTLDCLLIASVVLAAKDIRAGLYTTSGETVDEGSDDFKEDVGQLVRDGLPAELRNDLAQTIQLADVFRRRGRPRTANTIAYFLVWLAEIESGLDSVGARQRISRKVFLTEATIDKHVAAGKVRFRLFMKRLCPELAKGELNIKDVRRFAEKDMPELSRRDSEIVSSIRSMLLQIDNSRETLYLQLRIR